MATSSKLLRFWQLKRPNAAFLAAAAFVVIQTGLGIIFKIAQRDDHKYAFSQSASVTISEFLKLCLSAMFFYQQCWHRKREEAATDPEKRAYVALDRVSDDESSKKDIDSKDGSHRSSFHDEARQDKPSSPYSQASISLEDDEHPTWMRESASRESAKISLREYVSLVRNEINMHTVFGFAQLGLLYVMINNIAFVLFRLADPGTISLIRSGVTLITALNLRITTGQVISKKQWVAIIFQICGVMVTQYKPGQGTLYPFSTYLLIVFLTIVSAVGGVYNQILLKAEPGSLHVCNMSLYAAGTVYNLVIHFMSRSLRTNEPSFFTGYNSFGAIMVIVINVFIGLAITAVYKYADALIKCFATAVATGILLYIGPLIFHVPLNFLVIPGSITVFAATWLYLDSPSAKKITQTPWKAAEMEGSSRSGLKELYHKFSPHGRLRQLGLIITVSATVFLIIIVDVFAETSQRIIKSDVELVVSPFKDTLAFVRWNQALPERIPIIEEYRPFFREMHYSMPKYLSWTVDQNSTSHLLESNSFNNLTGDNSEQSLFMYITVAQTMQNILDAPANSTEATLNGIFYFHFDAWVDPLSFTSEDPNKIWFPDGMNPRWECIMQPIEYGPWLPFDAPWREHDKAANASEEIYHLVEPSLKHRLTPRQFCLGWSDIYFIPKRYFKDYIYLSRILLKHAVFHEVAIPTMIHTIDVMRRSNEREIHEVLTHIGDCWGSCCSANPSELDVAWHRCGHQIDLRNHNVTRSFFDRLDASAKMLGKPKYNATVSKPLMKADTIIDAGKVEAILRLPTTQNKNVYPQQP